MKSLVTVENVIKLLMMVFALGVLVNRLEGIDNRLTRIESIIDASIIRSLK
jgi:hypothetical protein